MMWDDECMKCCLLRIFDKKNYSNMIHKYSSIIINYLLWVGLIRVKEYIVHVRKSKLYVSTVC